MDLKGLGDGLICWNIQEIKYVLNILLQTQIIPYLTRQNQNGDVVLEHQS